jgi:hypothetical protein
VVTASSRSPPNAASSTRCTPLASSPDGISATHQKKEGDPSPGEMAGPELDRSTRPADAGSIPPTSDAASIEVALSGAKQTAARCSIAA